MSHPIRTLVFMVGEDTELQLAVDELNSATARWRDLDVDVVGSPAVDVMGSLGSNVNILLAAQSRLAFHIHDTESHKTQGFVSVGSMMETMLGQPKPETNRHLRMEKALGELPLVKLALRAGRLSLTQASLIAEGCADDPSRQQFLLDLAASACLDELREECHRQKSKRSKRDEQDEDRRRHEARICRVNANRDDGMNSLFAMLPPEKMAPWIAELDRRRDRIFREKYKDGVQDTFDQNMADAFMSILDDAMAHTSGKCSGKAKTQPPRFRPLVLIDYTALKRDWREAGERCEIAGVGQISVATAKTILDENHFKFLIANGRDVKTISSSTRYWKVEVQEALAFRDQRCSVPGCGQRGRLQKDHKQWFSKDGPTNLENGRHLCAYHHRLITTGGFDLIGEPGHWELVKRKPRAG